MAEENTSQTTEATESAATEAQTPTPEPAAIKDTIDANGKAEGESVEFESLFDSEDVSEAELKGEEEAEVKDDQESEETPSETKEETASSPSKDEKKPGEASEAEGEQADTKADEAKDEQGKPPKGFVPIQALHKERGQRQLLTQQVQDLLTEVTALKSGKTADSETEGSEKAQPEEAFEVLSEEAFDELLEDDPVEAIRYDRKLRAYETKLAEKDKAVKAEASVIEESLGMMATAIPGLYDTDSDVNQKLSDFAMEKGFADLDGLALVTDPRTRVVSANGGTPQLLGETAANLVIMLNTLFQESATLGDKNVDAEALEKAAEEKVRGKITKEVLAKLKLPAGAEHKSLGDVPGDSGDAELMGGPTNEADFAKLSEADQKRYLGG